MGNGTRHQVLASPSRRAVQGVVRFCGAARLRVISLGVQVAVVFRSAGVGARQDTGAPVMLLTSDEAFWR